MARLYEMPGEDTNPELTGSLARSFKDGLILPAERKFNLLEGEITALRKHMDTESQKLELRLKEYFVHLDAETSQLKKILRLNTYLSLLTLTGILTTLAVLFLR